MDIRASLEKVHSRANAGKIADFVGNSPMRFAALVKAFLEGPYRITQRAAWPLSICVEQHPGLASKHIPVLIAFARKPGTHPAVARNVMRLLQFAKIPSRHRGPVLDLAFTLLQDRRQPIAVRVFSMTVAHNLSKDEPGLLRELMILIEDELPMASAGFVARARKILRSAVATARESDG